MSKEDALKWMDSLITAKSILKDMENQKREDGIELCHTDLDVQVYKGIGILSASTGIPLHRESASNEYDKLIFTYNGVSFFQLVDKEMQNG